jgi:hypothetical protein
MPTVVIRVRFTSGDHIDVTYQHDEPVDEQEVIDHIVSTLALDAGVLRCTHGGRLVVLFGRAVASIELSPRGAVL